MSKLTDVFAQGTHAARPAAAAANMGYYYYETDTQTLFQSTGSAWTQLAASAAGGGGISASPAVDAFHLSADMSAAGPANVLVAFDVVDSGTHYSTGTHLWTAPAAGDYEIIYYLATTGGTGNIYQEIRKNGTSLTRPSPFAAPATLLRQYASCIVTLASSDTIGFYAETDSGTFTVKSDSTHCCAYIKQML